MKKEIIQTLKIVTLSLVFSASFAFATWVAMPTSPTPPTAPTTNIPTTINVGSASQVKTGGLSTGPLAVFGQSQMNGNVNIRNDQGGGNLYVSGKVGIGIQYPTEKLDILGNIKISSLSHSGFNSPVCSDNISGEIFLCPTVHPVGNISFLTPTTTDTWTVPTDVTTATFEVWGAGAGGGGGAVGATTSNTSVYPGTNLVDGAGGGGGGYYKTILTVVPGETYAITVGTHGSGGSGVTGAANAAATAGSGTAGTLSKVIKSSNSFIVAQGNGGLAVNTGAKISPTTPGTGGIGGSGSGTGGVATGGILFSGLNSSTNFLSAPDDCSNGGAGAVGAIGGRGGMRLPISNPICSNTSVHGSNGSQPGGGGGGGGWSVSGMSITPGNGGNGGDGKVKITW